MADENGPMAVVLLDTLRRHAIEPHDLEPTEAAAYMRDIQRVGAAVQRITGWPVQVRAVAAPPESMSTRSRKAEGG